MRTLRWPNGRASSGSSDGMPDLEGRSNESRSRSSSSSSSDGEPSEGHSEEDPGQQPMVAATRTPTALGESPIRDPYDEALVRGRNLKFKCWTDEQEYLQAKFAESKRALVLVWAMLTPVLLLEIYRTQFAQEWQPQPTESVMGVPLGLLVMFASQGIALAVAQVPLLVRFYVTRAETAEQTCIYSALFCTFLLAFPMNKWRCGFVFHGNGRYLYETAVNPGKRGHHHSDTLLWSCFFVFTLLYLIFPFIRYRMLKWWHQLPLAGMLLVFGGLLIPGMTPEEAGDVLMYSALMIVYLAMLQRTKEHAEYSDRVNFARLQELKTEAQKYRETQEKRQEEQRQREHLQLMKQLEGELAHAVENEDVGSIALAKWRFQQDTDLSGEELQELERSIRGQQSHERGVRLSYLLCNQFQRLAQHSSGQLDPTFHDLKDAFFLGQNAIGRDQICPRDGLPGCALVDTLPTHYRGQCTHFLSWTWVYRLGMVRECLQHWAAHNQADHASVSFFMCFFVNNQYRILASANPSTRLGKGSDNLELTFEDRLCRIGKMVALLDAYDRPVYLTRIWTIFEQFKAMELHLQVEMVMPDACSRALIKEFERGESGITNIRDSMTTVRSFHAKASDKADEEKVKRMIRDSVGFARVDKAITEVMTAWVAKELQSHMNYMMQVVEVQPRRTDFGSKRRFGATLSEMQARSASGPLPPHNGS